MWPSSPWRSRIGVKTRTPWMTPQRFTPSAQRQSCSVDSHTTPSGATPALLQTTCTAPNASSAARASRSTDSPCETSVGCAATRTRRARSSSAVRASAASSTSASTSFSPCAPKAPASARPRPDAAPVITATRPAKVFICHRNIAGERGRPEPAYHSRRDNSASERRGTSNECAQGRVRRRRQHGMADGEAGRGRGLRVDGVRHRRRAHRDGSRRRRALPARRPVRRSLAPPTS